MYSQGDRTFPADSRRRTIACCSMLQQYEAKRQRVLGNLTYLVEIDLLRQGRAMPIENNEIQSHYRILVSRSERRPQAELYAFNLRDAIPSFPLPLHDLEAPNGEAAETEPLVNLQALLHEVYDRGSYDLAIDDNRNPTPALSDADAAWVNGLLKEKGWRCQDT